MNLGPTELIIILAIIVVLFGVGRLSRLGGELGSGIKAFREGLKNEGEEAEGAKQEETAPKDA